MEPAVARNGIGGGFPSTLETAHPPARALFPYLCLAVFTSLCLLPFSGRAFHIDDTLFVWTAQHITKHPLDPYNFPVVWYSDPAMPVSSVTKNPPLACYYAAAIGRIGGWSERALHMGFLLPAIAVVLGTYRLARHFTENSLLAALATLLTPGFLVSACSVMCDVMMLALWLWAAILWIEGLERESGLYLAAAGFVIGACELTKYFGVALIVLLFVYTLARKRRLGTWVFYLLIPVAILVAYDYWTYKLYGGHGLFLDAGQFERVHHNNEHVRPFAKALIGLSFAGGCTLTALTFVPLLWRRKQISIAAAVMTVVGVIVATGLAGIKAPHARASWTWVSVQMAFFAVGGVSLLSLAVADCWKKRSPDSLFLALWVFGTFYFTVYLNYTINARSVLPLIPAAAILLARRVGSLRADQGRREPVPIALALLVAGILTFWIAWGDTAFANAQRRLAFSFQQMDQAGALWFEGHWGFQYYMEALGARPIDTDRSDLRSGDLVIVPNYQHIFPPPKEYSLLRKIAVNLPVGVATQDWDLGAGFYSSRWGPLPFAFGAVEYQYYVLQLGP